MLDRTTACFERLNAPVPWAEVEVDRLFRLRVELGWDWAAIAVEMGRTESGVKSKFKAMVHQRSYQAPSQPGRDPIPDSVLAEQARRLVAWGERSLTAAVLGDPAPGWSALDRRGA